MRKNVRGQPQVLFALFFETGSQIYQSWLASKPQESACLHLPRAELTIAFKHSHLLNIDSWARTQVLDLAEQDLNWLDHLPSPASGFYLYGFFASQLTCLLRSFIVSHLLAPLWVIWSPLRPRFYLEVDFLFQSSGFLGLAQILPGVLCSCLCDRSLIFFWFFFFLRPICLAGFIFSLVISGLSLLPPLLHFAINWS